MGADSEYTPASPTNMDPYSNPMTCPASPINNGLGGQSPYANAGAQNYSPTSPAYPKPGYAGGYAAKSPAYNSSSPAYNATGIGGGFGGGSPSYAPYSPARYGVTAGGATPAYSGAMSGGYGMSPTAARPMGIPGASSSPMYSPTGNPAYSPT